MLLASMIKLSSSQLTFSFFDRNPRALLGITPRGDCSAGTALLELVFGFHNFLLKVSGHVEVPLSDGRQSKNYSP